MTITIEYNRSEKNKVTKDVVILKRMDGGALRTGSSLMDPEILIGGLDASVTVDDVTYDILKTANYAYIPDFGRFYFIQDISTDANGLFVVKMHVDVLTSYHDQILAQKAIVKRQENSWNLYLDDGTFKTYQNPIIDGPYMFPAGFSAQSYVLAVAGSN